MTFDTRIHLYKRVSKRENGVSVVGPADTPLAAVWCDWKYAFGNQAIRAYELGITEMATVRIRWSKSMENHLDGTCYVLKSGKFYEIMTEPNDIDDTRTCIEFKVKRWCDG